MTAIDITEPQTRSGEERPRFALMVIGARRGCGATTIAAAIADVAASMVTRDASGEQVNARAALMDVSAPYDAVDLASTSNTQPLRVETADPGVHFVVASRSSGATYVGLDAGDPNRSGQGGFFGRHLVPEPDEWLRAAGSQQIIVADSGWCPLEGLGQAGDRFGQWAQLDDVATYPIVVMPASRPAAQRAEALLELLEQTGAQPALIAVPRATAATPEAVQAVVSQDFPRVQQCLENKRVTLFPYDAVIERDGVPAAFEKSTFAPAHQALVATGALNGRTAR